MKMIKKDFIVTTTNGTRWSATGTSLTDVRENFNTGIFGNIANVKAGSLFPKSDPDYRDMMPDSREFYDEYASMQWKD
jgi:hypothetical protein